MSGPRRQALRILGAAALALCSWNTLSAQDELPQLDASQVADPQPSESQQESDDSPGDESTARALIQKLMERLEKVESELERLKSQRKEIPADEKDQKVHLLLETPYLGSSFYRSANGVRFFAAKLIVVNLTPQAVSIKKEDIQLEADGKAFALGDVPPRIQYQSFQVGSQTLQLRSLKPEDEVNVPAGGTGSTWVVFTDLSNGAQVPSLVLKVKVGDKVAGLNVNDLSAERLGLSAQRVGPRGCLALLNISGALDTINVGALVSELDRMSAQKVARVVISWSETAAALEPQLAAWLRQAAADAGREDEDGNRFPLMPATIRELHLAQIPGDNDANRQAREEGLVHKDEAEAISAALSSAYQVLPREELLAEIQSGHPLTRAAAIEGGGGRLPTEKIPLLLKFADDDDPRIQQAALVALRHVGEQAAIDKLLHYVQKNVNPMAEVAVESLAASRFAAAHEALLAVLINEPADSKARIVTVLARYPRPVWSEPIYEFASDPNSPAGSEALAALARIGHPKLVELLRGALQGDDKKLSGEAFAILVERTDAESEELALGYTLEHLKTSPPTPPMYALLNRTKDQRAVPLLLAHLDRPGGNRAMVVNALATLGDQTVADVLAQKYAQFKSNEQTSVLNALLQLKSPSFRKLAGEALLSNDSSLVNTACRGLQTDGSAEAIEMLIGAFEQSDNASTWSHVATALSTLATPEAKAALFKARESENANKQVYARNALRNIWQRSPGFQYVYQGREMAQEEQWKEAYELFSTALQVDPELPDAYAERAHILLQQQKAGEAKADFTKALELDPYNSVAVAGMAIAMVSEGSYEEGIKFVEDARSKFDKDQLFAYNAACVYSKALGHLQEHKDVAGRDEKMPQYQEKAITELQRAVKLQFGDFEWMKKDPDLKPLHDVPAFKQLVEGGE